MKTLKIKSPRKIPGALKGQIYALKRFLKSRCWFKSNGFASRNLNYLCGARLYAFASFSLFQGKGSKIWIGESLFFLDRLFNCSKSFVYYFFNRLFGQSGFGCHLADQFCFCHSLLSFSWVWVLTFVAPPDLCQPRDPCQMPKIFIFYLTQFFRLVKSFFPSQPDFLQE